MVRADGNINEVNPWRKTARNRTTHNIEPQIKGSDQSIFSC